MPTIHTRIEGARGCGYRKEGGLYFISDGIGSACYKLPILLEICPCCGQGIKFSRGFTWIDSGIFANAPCVIPSEKETGKSFANDCDSCPMNLKKERMGLLWVGEKYYTTPMDFTKEAIARGVSKRISQVPKDFVIGKTWIALAHIKAYKQIEDGGDISYAPGIFHAFKPSRIEYVVTGKETTEELENMEKRGYTLVKVIKDTEAQIKLI